MSTKRDTVIVSTARTALAKSFRGSFNMTRPDDMAAEAVRPPDGRPSQRLFFCD